MTRRAILHFGTMKTGTTTLQETLSQNPEWLNQFNYTYLGWPMRHHVPILRRLEEVDDTANIIISDEGLWHHFGTVHSRTDILARELRGFEVTVVVYLRRPDHFVEAWLSQGLKTGAGEPTLARFLTSIFVNDPPEPPQATETTAAGAPDPIDAQGEAGVTTPPMSDLPNDPPVDEYSQINLKLLSRLRGLDELFGHDNVIVRPFERSQLIGGDIVSDFLATTKLNVLESPDGATGSLPPSTVENKNVSPPADAVLMSALLRSGFEVPQEVLDRLMTTFSSDRYDERQRSTILRIDEARRILDITRPIFEEIQSTWGGGQEPDFFTDWSIDEERNQTSPLRPLYDLIAESTPDERHNLTNFTFPAPRLGPSSARPTGASETSFDVVHIGLGKCMSTTLQSLWRRSDNYHMRSANALNRDVEESVFNLRRSSPDYYAAANFDFSIAGDVDPTRINVLSSDGITFSALHDIAYARLIPAKQTALARILANAAPKVLLMLRDPIDWIASAHAQQIREGGTIGYDEYIVRFAPVLLNNLNLRHIINAWQGVDREIVILPVELKQRSDDTFWEAYETLLGVERPEAAADTAAVENRTRDATVGLHRNLNELLLQLGRIVETSNSPDRKSIVEAVDTVRRIGTRRAMEGAAPAEIAALSERWSTISGVGAPPRVKEMYRARLMENFYDPLSKFDNFRWPDILEGYGASIEAADL